MIQGTIGAMRHRLTIRTAVTSSDGRGGQAVTSWTNTASGVSAEVQPTNGREFYQGGALRNAMGYRVRMRYHSAVTPKARLYLEGPGTILEVLEVVNIGQRNTELLVSAVEVDA